MFENNRSKIRQALDAVFIVALLGICLAFAYSLGSSKAYYTQRASHYSHNYAQEAEERMAKECADRQADAFADCVKKIVESTRDAQRSEYDLGAQEAMAEWAFWMLVTSAAGFVVGALGVFFVALTLAETRKAVKAADDAVKETRRIGEAEVRAYMSLGGLGFQMLANEGKTPISVRIWSVVNNTGSTPATCVKLFSRVVWKQNDGSIPFPELEFDDYGPERFVRGAGESIQLVPSDLDFETIDRAGRREIRLFMLNYVKYRDVFYPQSGEHLFTNCVEIVPTIPTRIYPDLMDRGLPPEAFTHLDYAHHSITMKGEGGAPKSQLT